MEKLPVTDSIHDFSVWLRTIYNPSEINWSRSPTGIFIVFEHNKVRAGYISLFPQTMYTNTVKIRMLSITCLPRPPSFSGSFADFPDVTLVLRIFFLFSPPRLLVLTSHTGRRSQEARRHGTTADNNCVEWSLKWITCLTSCANNLLNISAKNI